MQSTSVPTRTQLDSSECVKYGVTQGSVIGSIIHYLNRKSSILSEDTKTTDKTKTYVELQ